MERHNSQGVPAGCQHQNTTWNVNNNIWRSSELCTSMWATTAEQVSHVQEGCACIFCVLSPPGPGVGNNPATGCTIQRFEVINSDKSELNVNLGSVWQICLKERAMGKMRKLSLLFPFVYSFLFLSLSENDRFLFVKLTHHQV